MHQKWLFVNLQLQMQAAPCPVVLFTQSADAQHMARAAECGVYVVQGSAQAAMQTAQQAFEAALTYLNGIPLSTPAIAKPLEAAGLAWQQMLVG